MRTVDDGADDQVGGQASLLAERVQEALGELAGAAKEGLLALSVGVGLGVLAEPMAEEVEDVVGPMGRHEGRSATAMRLARSRSGAPGAGRAPAGQGERRIGRGAAGHLPALRRPRSADRAGARADAGRRLRAPVPAHAEPVGQQVAEAERSTSKRAVSREFVTRTGEHLAGRMSRRLDDVRLAALMLDGIELKGRCCVVCLGITTDGVKIPLGL